MVKSTTEDPFAQPPPALKDGSQHKFRFTRALVKLSGCDREFGIFTPIQLIFTMLWSMFKALQCVGAALRELVPKREGRSPSLVVWPILTSSLAIK